MGLLGGDGLLGCGIPTFEPEGCNLVRVWYEGYQPPDFHRFILEFDGDIVGAQNASAWVFRLRRAGGSWSSGVVDTVYAMSGDRQVKVYLHADLGGGADEYLWTEGDVYCSGGGTVPLPQYGSPA